MSIELMSRVWKCDLPPNLTLVLLAMADIARDDGSRCYPSVDFLAWKCNYSRRQIQNIIGSLRAKAILLVVRNDQGGRGMDGRGQSTEYLIKVDHISPKAEYVRSSSRASKKGEDVAPLTVQSTTKKGEAHCTHEGETCDKEGCNLRQGRVQPTSPNPLVNSNDPLVNSLSDSREENQDRETPEYQFWESVLAELQSQVTRPSYETWLKETRCIQLSRDVATILVINTFIRDMLNERMYSLISMACSKIPPHPSEVLFEVS